MNRINRTILKDQLTYRSTDEYMAMQSEPVRQKLEELRAIILKEVPEAEELINYNIPAFALVPGGKRDQQVLIAGYKRHIGFYPTPAVMELFEPELGEYKRGRGSVQFPLDTPLPEALIRRMVRVRLEQINERG